ncbi:MAG TPA: AAA domain-containing protein [Chloroflexota bacterium]|nr:AAA domain-containing protein [Chloroflexota bacterium]
MPPAAGTIAALCEALGDEVQAIRSSGAGRRISLTQGRALGRGEQWVYAFSTDSALAVPDDSPAQLELPGASRRIPCQVLGCGTFEVTLGLGSALPAEALPRVLLLLDPSFLLEALALQLGELDPSDCMLAERLFSGTVRAGRHAPRLAWPEGLNEFQFAAVQAASGQDVTFVWGPPGTGKTTTLAHIAHTLVQQGLRVLLTAATNVAVDNATLRTAELLGEEGLVLRLGTPRLAALLERPLLQLDGLALATSGGVEAERLALAQRRHDLLYGVPEPDHDDAQLSLFAQLPGTPRQRPPRAATAVRALSAEQLEELDAAERDLRRRLDEARGRALNNARVVTATLSRTFLPGPVAGQAFDAVLIDEASAAPLPAVFFATALARRKAVALGDPKQLPPIAVANTPAAGRWLRRDIFQQAGLDDDDDRAVLLREQYRMQPGISRLANELVYGGRLIDGVPSSGQPAVRLLDTSHLEAECERPPSGSRRNLRHAHLAVEAAEAFLRGSLLGPGGALVDSLTWPLEPGGGAAPLGRSLPAELALNAAGQARSVGIIAPYAAQATLIWRLVRERGLDGAVDVGTVHRFQGLERDVIVFDTVEAPPLHPAPFVAGGPGSEAMRLINVALTRARSQLVVLAAVDHLRATLQPRATLRRLLDLLLSDE